MRKGCFNLIILTKVKSESIRGQIQMFLKLVVQYKRVTKGLYHYSAKSDIDATNLHIQEIPIFSWMEEKLFSHGYLIFPCF